MFREDFRTDGPISYSLSRIVRVIARHLMGNYRPSLSGPYVIGARERMGNPS